MGKLVAGRRIWQAQSVVGFHTIGPIKYLADDGRIVSELVSISTQVKYADGGFRWYCGTVPIEHLAEVEAALRELREAHQAGGLGVYFEDRSHRQGCQRKVHAATEGGEPW